MTAHPPVEPGSILAGRYRVEEVLGKGQMGVVVAATHIGLNRRYAIKFLIGDRAGPESYERFLREARAAVQLESQHVARVFDVGTLDDGAPYMVMEMLRGRDLADVLRERTRLPIEEAVEYILHACEALSEAHRAGIVHRDIKPANLFLATTPSGDPCVKVLDFGVSKMSASEGEPGSSLKLTHDRQLLGSPLYMSAEQLLSSKDVDARSDIWSLGVTLYELCTGAVPFPAENFTGLSTAVLAKPPTPMTQHLADVPPAFEAIIFQALNKDRERRWPSIGAFANALAPFAPARAAAYVDRAARIAGEQSQPARPTAVLPIAAEASTAYGSGSTSAIMSPVAAQPPVARRGASVVVAGGVVLGAVALTALAAVWWTSSRHADVALAASGASSASSAPGPGIIVPPASSSTSAPARSPASAEQIPTVTPSATVSASVAVPPTKPKAPTPRPSPPPAPPHQPTLYER